MGRPPLSIDIASKDQRELAKLLSGGVQQVRVVLRAVALLQLAKGVSAPQIANLVPLTSQAIRNIGRRYQQGGLERALYESRGGKKMWVCADLDDDYIAKMEDVLEVYERPYNPQEPVICVDEKPITLHADLRPSSPAIPGREARRDNEYERRGTTNVFCAVEPKAAAISPSPRRIARASNSPRLRSPWRWQYPEAETIHLVLDNLNIHRRKALADVFGTEMATEVWDRFTVHLHAHSRQLAESGGDRNRNLLAAMPGASTHP